MPAATPAVLPVPIVAASAVMNAWNGDNAPVAPDAGFEKNARTASPNRRTCTNPSRTVRNSPVPKRTTTRIGMKRKSAVDWRAVARAESTKGVDCKSDSHTVGQSHSRTVTQSDSHTVGQSHSQQSDSRHTSCSSVDMRAQTIEDLHVWRKARDLERAVHALLRVP